MNDRPGGLLNQVILTLIRGNAACDKYLVKDTSEEKQSS
jgi:hypothetical protein